MIWTLLLLIKRGNVNGEKKFIDFSSQVCAMLECVLCCTSDVYKIVFKGKVNSMAGVLLMKLNISLRDLTVDDASF